MSKKRANVSRFRECASEKGMAKPQDRADPGLGISDPEAFARNLARMVEEAGKAASAYLRPREEGKIPVDFADGVGEVVKTLARVGEYWLAEPGRAPAGPGRPPA